MVPAEPLDVARAGLRHDPDGPGRQHGDERDDDGDDDEHGDFHGYSRGYTRAVAPSISMTSTVAPTGMVSVSS